MKATLIRIGNSQGIRIPKSLIDELQLKKEVELDLGPEGLLIKPLKKNRRGWEESFKKMHAHKDEVLADPEESSEWDKSEWKW